MALIDDHAICHKIFAKPRQAGYAVIIMPGLEQRYDFTQLF